MSSSRTLRAAARISAALVLVAALAPAGWGQGLTDYSKPKSHLVNPIAPYTGRDLPAPNFSNTARIHQLIRDGKLMLSMNDAIALALENNLDLAIARYNLSIADTDVLRTKAGANTLGVAAGLVSGTPGGGVGGFGSGAQGAGAGGTTSAAGGAATGTAGIVSSTAGAGAAVESFDPRLSSTLSIEHAKSPVTSPFVSGPVPSSFLNTGTANFTYSQGFATGTDFSIGYNNNRQTSSDTFNFLNPVVNSSYRITLRQRLLSGFGPGPNLRFIRIAKNNREISDVAFRQQVEFTVSQIQNIYWDLVNAYEDVTVKQRSIGLAQKTLSDNRKQVEIGSLAPIEVVRAQSQFAANQQDLIVSQTNLQLQELLMKNAITRNMDDPLLSAAPVIPTDTMSMPSVEPVVPTQDLISEALSNRPEISQAQIDLANRAITRKAARNALLPSVDFVSWYGTAALAGDQNAAFPSCTSALSNVFGCLAPGSIPSRGFGGTFSTLFGNDFPDYGVGINVNIPIRNRAAQADQVRSELESRQAQMRLQQLQNQVRIEVRNAQFAVQQNRARVEAARSGRALAAETLDAEQKKFQLGASTNTLVLQAQRDMTQSEVNLVQANTAYEKSRVELDRVTSRTLSNLGIELMDAETGNVRKAPKVPSVIQRQDMNSLIQSQPPQSFQPPAQVPPELKPPPELQPQQQQPQK